MLEKTFYQVQKGGVRGIINASARLVGQYIACRALCMGREASCGRARAGVCIR
jgi:hypothetical protein